MKPGFLGRLRLVVVRLWLSILNLSIAFFRKIIFPRKISDPQNILVYKLGNIGDIICAMPALFAIKKKYQGSRVVLLTSPGKSGAIGAKEILSGAPYLDDIVVYHFEDVSSLKRIFSLASKLREKKYDLFIQLPDDWSRFRTMVRNIIFAKAIGAKSAFGFYLRTSWLFKKAQIDFSYKETEAVALLRILERHGINFSEVRFEFPNYVNSLAAPQKAVADLKKVSDLVMGVCMGGKTEAQKWPAENFAKTLFTLKKKYKIGVVFFGDYAERRVIEQVSEFFGGPVANFAGRPIQESITAIKRLDFFLTNDTGPMHIAAAFGIPLVAIFSIKNVFGAWFPYGKNNVFLYKKFLNCNYRDPSCVKRSVTAIALEEVIGACEEVLGRIKTR